MSDTEEIKTKKKPRGAPFMKGADPRRGKGGRPRSFNVLRAMAQEIAAEVGEDGVTTMERILREWSTSKNPIERKGFIELAFGKVPEAPVEDEKPPVSPLPSLPADLIAMAFADVFRAIKSGDFTEFVLFGGRGSAKSSFVSLVFIWLMVNNPQMHGMAVRQVANTLRDSVYSQLVWAISVLGLTDSFKTTVAPMQIEYIPTGQIIYFRGADDPSKLKSIKPPFGYIGILWEEELDAFHGPEAVRKIEQSVMRGGERSYLFKTFNPPRTSSSWANRYVQVKKDGQFQHKSDYRSVPPEWLGEPFLMEAEHLKKVNPDAYRHEYLGEPNFAGGMVFNNVVVKPVTDEEIKEFAQPLNGLDFGFYPDPAHFAKCHYDPARSTLTIYGEVRRWKTSNENMYKAIKTDGGYEDWELLTYDSAEPKSGADFRSYGATARPAQKGKDSVSYSMKWLQSLSEIVIDQARCPYAAKEFTEYEFERTKDDEVISAYPDANNHAIDAVRYATNHVWKRRGE